MKTRTSMAVMAVMVTNQHRHGRRRGCRYLKSKSRFATEPAGRRDTPVGKSMKVKPFKDKLIDSDFKDAAGCFRTSLK